MRRVVPVLLATAVLALPGCSASACEQVRAGDPGVSAPIEEQGEYAEALAQCMLDEPEGGSSG